MMTDIARNHYPRSSGAMVRPASASCSQYSSAGSRCPLQTRAWPVLWMRSANAYPDATLIPGIVRASVTATWSKVLWSSLRTITRQAPPSPLSGPAVRGRSMVCGIPLGIAAPVPLESQVLLFGRRGELHRVALARRARDERAPRVDPRVLLQVARPRRPLLEVRAHAVEVGAHVVVAAEMRGDDRARVPALDEVEGGPERLHVDVGRRRRPDRRAVADAPPACVAGERRAAGLVQVADVVRRMPGRVRRAEAEVEAIALAEHAQAVPRDGQRLAPQRAHVLLAVQPRGAAQQLL